MNTKQGMPWRLFTLMFLFGVTSALRAEDPSALSVKLGMSERIRNEYYNNTTDMNADKNDQNDYFRIRTSVWGQVQYKSYITAYAKFTNEFRKYIKDPKVPKRDFTWDEIFVDNLYLKLDSPCKRFALTVGRQNLMYGEGFILMDGSPWDGSRSIYYDAVKLSATFGKTVVDLLGIDNTRIEDRLPVIRSDELSDGKLKGQTKDQMMNDGEEKAFGAYVTTTAWSKAKIEAYGIRKIEKPNPWIPKGPVNKSDLTLNTLGARLSGFAVTPRLGLTAEWAYQFGDQGAINQNSFGGYTYLTYQMWPDQKDAVSFGFIALSGDDPKTANNEGWNPLFSRWPKWSELYIYSIMNETIEGASRVAYWTNLFAPYLSYTAPLTPKLTIILNYFNLNAMQARTFTDGILSGKARGNEVQCWLKYVYNKNISGHILLDYLIPGTFYQEPRTPGPFIRGELLFAI
jgi:hypothetical protein